MILVGVVSGILAFPIDYDRPNSSIGFIISGLTAIGVGVYKIVLYFDL
jgi:hypothetical protein